MGIIAWIVLGLIAGAIAKAIMPGNDPGGIIVTILIGIVGAFLGGFLGNMITGAGLNGFSLWSIVLAIVGSLHAALDLSHDDADARHDRPCSRRDSTARSERRPHGRRRSLRVYVPRVPLAFDRAHPDPSLMAPWLFWLSARSDRRLAREIPRARPRSRRVHLHHPPRHRRRVLGGLIGTRLGWGTVTSGDLDLRSIGIATFGAMILPRCSAESLRRSAKMTRADAWLTLRHFFGGAVSR